MRGKIKGISSDGKAVYIELSEDFRPQYEKLKNIEISIEIKQYTNRRSLNANAFAWEYIGKLADVLNTTKEEVYRELVRRVGAFSTLTIKDEAVDMFATSWAARGIGWQCEIIAHQSGYSTLMITYGSSVYDTHRMSILIDELLSECKTMGIPTDDAREQALIMTN